MLRVLPNKVVVLVPRFGIEGMIPLGELEDKGQLKYDADRQTLAGPKGTRVTVLDRVKVRAKDVATRTTSGPVCREVPP